MWQDILGEKSPEVVARAGSGAHRQVSTLMPRSGSMTSRASGRKLVGMTADEAAVENDSRTSPYARLPDSIDPEAMTTSTDPDLPSVDGTGVYDQQESFLRSYGAG